MVEVWPVPWLGSTVGKLVRTTWLIVPKSSGKMVLKKLRLKKIPTVKDITSMEWVT